MSDQLHLDVDTIIDLAAGLVTGSERRRLLSHIRSCGECERRLMTALADDELSRMPARAMVPVSGVPGASASRIRLFRIAVPLLLAAATLLIVIGRIGSGPAAPPVSWWMPATADLLQLRDVNSPESDSAFWEGLDAYQRHDVPAAMAAFERSRATGAFDDLRRLYMASLELHTGRPQGALSRLESLQVAYLPEPWRGSARMIEYLALKALGRDAGPPPDSVDALVGRRLPR
ncbi:MAG TPA: hypothetical protein VF720_08935 [Candidatus Eisenbacteria bacterium]